MIDKIYIFDDIISKEEQEDLKNTLLGNDFPWFYLEDVTSPKANLQSRSGFCHNFYNDYQVKSSRVKLIKNVIDNSLKKINFKLNKIIKSRAFLQVPLRLDVSENLIDSPHIDIDIEHLVVLYYVTDTDGDTILYNETFKDGIELPSQKDVTERQRITPKQGRVVVFNGNIYHSGTQSINNNRVLINTNVI